MSTLQSRQNHETAGHSPTTAKKPRNFRLVGFALIAASFLPATGAEATSPQLASPSGAEDPSPLITASSKPICGLPEETAGRHIPDTAGPKEVAPAHEWLEREPESVAALAEALEPYRGSLLGSIADMHQQRMIVVVDPDHPDLIDEIRGKVAALLPARSGLRVHVVPGCRSLSDIQEMVDELARGDWRARDDARSNSLRDSYFSIGIDPATGAVEVGLAPHEEHLQPVLQATYGDSLTFTTYVSADRLNDGSPHYGGARIVELGVYDNCTAGFAVDKAGGRWMVTAGHCLQEGGPFYSGFHFYGNEHDWSPTGDVSLIGDGTEQYSRVIHVDPCSPCTRLVNSASTTPSFGISNYCVSGSVTRAKCSLILTGTILVCDNQANCWVAWKAKRTGVVVVQEGDSGGPVYYRNGSTTARIYGMIVALIDPLSGPPWKSDTVVFTDVGDIQAELGVTVATSCCNGTSW